VIEGVGVLPSSLVGVEGTVGVWLREEELERDGMVIARRKRSLSGILTVVFVIPLCLFLGLRGDAWFI